MLNISAEQADIGAGVLVRALAPTSGPANHAAQQVRRSVQNLTRGPGRLCAALGLSLGLSGMPVETDGLLTIGEGKPAPQIEVGPLIGITRNPEPLWRYCIAGNAFVSGAETEERIMEPLAIDWRGIFMPALGLPEIFVRGTIMYLAMFVILRFIARRQAGSFGPADLLVIVLIADAAQNGLGKDYTSVTEGIALVLTIVGWEYVLDWLAWKFPSLRPWLNAPPLKLVEDGRPVKASLDRELLSYDELMAQLREHDVERCEDVRVAYLEGDGRLSALKKRP